MILAVSIGNTNIRAVAGCHIKSDSVCLLPVDMLSDSESFLSFITEHFGVDFWENLEGTIVSSVVPSKLSVVTKAIITKNGIPPQRVRDKKRISDINLYDGFPGEDRIVCCVGALQKYRPPFIILDFGTATTFNIINDSGKFIGGAILSGVSMGLNALSGNTAQLPEINIGGDIPLIGTTTAQNLLSGALIGAACTATEYIRRAENETGYTLPVIITGGHAPFLLPFLEFNYIHEPNLLLTGLFALYESQ